MAAIVAASRLAFVSQVASAQAHSAIVAQGVIVTWLCDATQLFFSPVLDRFASGTLPRRIGSVRGQFSAEIVDDGIGLEAPESKATSGGGHVVFLAGADGRGTRVALVVPLTPG